MHFSGTMALPFFVSGCSVVVRLRLRLKATIGGFRLSGLLILWVIALTQDPSRSAAQSAAPSAARAPSSPSEGRDETLTLKTTTHYVVLDILAKNKQGRPLLDLTQNDFQIFERVGWGAKLPETISAFRLVDKSKPQPKPVGLENLIHPAPGSYSNVMAVREPDDPLTVLLLDGVNTNLFAPDTRRNVLKMVDSTDLKVPVSVFYLGNNLRMLQDFDSDAKRLRSTVHGLLNTGPYHELRFDTVGPSPAMQQQLGVAASGPSSLFYSVDEARLTTDRVRMTLDALRTLARHLAGYPGRKKLVWISDSFPASIMDPYGLSDSQESFHDQIAEMANALSSARISVYPIRPAGLWLSDVFSAARRSRPAGGPNAVSGELNRQSAADSAASATLEQISEQTGGQTCLSSNELDWCLKQVLSDGYTYYELAYYPNAEGWKEGFHHITVKISRPGVRLSYRQGYNVEHDEAGSPSPDRVPLTASELRQAACEDQLTATALALSVIPLASRNQSEARYLLKVENRPVVPAPEKRSSALELSFAACAFDASGKPLQYGQFPLNQVKAEKASDPSMRFRFEQIFGFAPNPHAARIRWLVQDAETGALGSVDLPYPAPVSAAAENLPANTAGTSQTATLSSVLANAIPAEFMPDSPSNRAAASLAGPNSRSNAEVASYCDALGQAGSHADALSKVCQFTLLLQSNLPNLVCERVTTRHWRTLNHFPMSDVVTTQVAYQDGIEYDRDVVPVGKQTRYSVFRRVNSSATGGEFASLLEAIFHPASAADFEFKGEESLNSAQALVFDFQVEQNNNHLYYLRAIYADGGLAVFYPAYRGRLWVDKATFALLRAERETVDVPPRFPINSASTGVDYSSVGLGDGTSFVLPVNAVDATCSPDEGNECAHNVIRYTNYQKFRAKTKLVFTQEAQ